jgi:hypothetical protein
VFCVLGARTETNKWTFMPTNANYFFIVNNSSGWNLSACDDGQIIVVPAQNATNEK